MFIAMNRFQIVRGSEEDFENVWRNRDSYLDKVAGFKEFHLIKGESNEEYTLYASHSTWTSQADFIAWTKSDSFKAAHQNAGNNKKLYLGHPVFEGFDVIL
tara:strand:- start:54 stop:356 length:303 start_codon:yes stop_codon:yes gene_type:complete